jgi:ATP-binding cassette subfamily C exporter for protease/lipase
MPTQVMRESLRLCRRHLVGAGWFSALINLLYIAPTLYMLQVYDRVVPTHGLQTLSFLTVVLLFALATLSLLDRIRSRLLVRAGVQLDTTLAPLILDATLGRPDLPVARQALREFDTMRRGSRSTSSCASWCILGSVALRSSAASCCRS